MTPEATYTPNPIDTDDPVAISHRLGEIEDELAFLGTELSSAAYWLKKLKGQIQLDSQMAYLSTEGTIPEREAKVAMILAGDPTELPQKLILAEATHARYKQQFEILDTRRSILQTAMKPHVKDQEPRYGQGAGR